MIRNLNKNQEQPQEKVRCESSGAESAKANRPLLLLYLETVSAHCTSVSGALHFEFGGFHCAGAPEAWACELEPALAEHRMPPAPLAPLCPLVWLWLQLQLRLHTAVPAALVRCGDVSRRVLPCARRVAAFA